ncbi:pleckstrin homology domain-containing family O member 2-like isoform X2 [Brienomyrus brachyistius]|nr:pleckstrin homology domain-containing family O member 2-like isoform X2 [Brienomyrus brachyistius]
MAGWLKKSSGRFLGSYKDRYISVERTEIVVYENEDLEKCIERVDLEKYDKCCTSRGPFQKKNRLVLIPAPKSKVHEVKLQVTDPGQKDAWLMAISDAINRAKNKIFDEVKVDESSSLEHVTRTRPKGNRSRRPPTRIHMKEAANTSSDGILRLDLDLVAVDTMPNGSCEVKAETEAPKETIKPPMPPNKPSEAPPQDSGEEDGLQKSAIKPPMPPSSDSKPKEASPQDSGEEDGLQKSAIKPPMPPSSDSKPKEASPQDSGEEDGPQKAAIKPPMPPSIDSKPTASPVKEPADDNCSSEIQYVPSSSPADMTSTSSEKAESDETPSADDPSPPSKNLQPPMPPSKDKKPILKREDAVPEQPLSVEGNKDERPVEPTSEDHPSTSPEETASGKDTTSSAEATVTPSKEVSSAADKEDFVLAAKEPEPNNLTAISMEQQELVTSSSVMKEEDEPKVIDLEPCASNTKPPEQIPERVKKGPAPPAPPKKKPVKPPLVIAGQCNVKASPANVPSVESGNQTVIKPVETVSMETNLEAISCSTDTNSVILPTISSMEAENESVNIKSTVPDGQIVPSTITIAESKEDPPKVDDEVSLEPKKDGVVIVLTSYDSGGNLNLSLEKIDRDEMRSSDSGQHSDEEMESGDNIRASTIALSGSRTRLEEEICEDGADSMDNHGLLSLSGNVENLHDLMKRALIPELSESFSPAFIPFVTRKCLSVGDLLSTSQSGPKPSVRNDAHELQGKASPNLTATGEPFDKVSEGKGKMSTSALKPTEQDQLDETSKRHQKARIFKAHTTRRQSW